MSLDVEPERQSATMGGTTSLQQLNLTLQKECDRLRAENATLKAQALDLTKLVTKLEDIGDKVTVMHTAMTHLLTFVSSTKGKLAKRFMDGLNASDEQDT